MASKFEQYLEILNNKGRAPPPPPPKRDDQSDGQQDLTNSRNSKDNSPLRTKHYLKGSNNEAQSVNQYGFDQRDEASHNTLQPPRGIHPEMAMPDRRLSHYDFSKVEMPFNNFHSLQETRERERMAEASTLNTLQQPPSENTMSKR